MKTTILNGTIWPTPNPSFTREPPGIENDEKWEELARARAFPLTREDVVKLGKDPDKVAKFDDAYWGLGDDAYMAELDVRHVCVPSFTYPRGFIYLFYLFIFHANLILNHQPGDPLSKYASKTSICKLSRLQPAWNG